MACCTEVIFSASSSGISHSNSSSSAITSSTVSSESAPRSSTNEALLVTSSSLTPSCSTTIFLTRSSMLLMGTGSSGETVQTGSVRESRGARAQARASLERDVGRRGRGRSGHVHAAVDVQGFAGDVAGVRARQERDRPGDVRGLAQAAQCDLADQAFTRGFGQRTGHVGVDESGRNHIDRYAPRTDFLRQGFGEPDDPRLRRRVIGLAGIAGDADDGGDVDDAPPARLHHGAHDRLAGAIDAGEVGVEDGVPVLVLHPHQQVVAGDAGIVDEDRNGSELGGDRIDERIDRRSVVHVQRPAVTTGCGEPLVDCSGAGVGRRRADHCRALRGQFVGDGGADAAAGTGDQRNFSGKCVVHALLHSLCAASNSDGVPSARASSERSMRLASPDNTLPGPHSAMRVTPRAASACTQSVHWTGRYNWRTSASRMDDTSSCTFASTFWTTGMRGGCHDNPAIVSPRRWAASRISGVCDGTLTASFTALRTPRSASNAIARSTAAACPPMTIWPGELKFAGTTISSPDAALHTSSTSSSSAPSTAAIAPVPAGAASCINWPRRRTRRAPSRSDSVPAVTSAVYSPRLWPASTEGCAPPCFCH